MIRRHHHLMNLMNQLLKLAAPASAHEIPPTKFRPRNSDHENMPTQPSATPKRLAKASAGVIGSSTRFERMLRESGAFDALSPQEVVQLQHTIEQYAAAIAANSGLRVRGAVQVRDAALSRAEARGGASSR
jgi:hypothetical protein